jgi:hypothetical protein
MPLCRAMICGIAVGGAWLSFVGQVQAQEWIPIGQVPAQPPVPTAPTVPPVPRTAAPLPMPSNIPSTGLPVPQQPAVPQYPAMPVQPQYQAMPLQPQYQSMPMQQPLLEAQPSFVRQPLPTGEAKPVGQRPVDLKPLPGSLEYSFEQELANREAQRLIIWNGTTIQNFPTTLLWEPVYASKREPRMMIGGTNYQNYVNDRTLETSIGTTIGLWRITPPGHDWAFQVDLFGVVHTRLSPQDLMAADYRFGVPITFRWEDWHGKIGYEHTSTHLGDEYQRNTGVLPYNFSKDELVTGLGRYFLDRSLRVYGQVSYAFSQDLLNDPNRFRFDSGFQYVVPNWGSSGSPFVAAHADFQGVLGFNPNINLQAGWLWRNPTQRLANARVFVEYYRGRSPYGQFAFVREDFYGVGAALDF